MGGGGGGGGGKEDVAEKIVGAFGGRGLAVVDEEALCDELAKSDRRSDDDSGHSLVEEPERGDLRESEDSESASNGDEQRTVLKGSLLPVESHARHVSMMSVATDGTVIMAKGADVAKGQWPQI